MQEINAQISTGLVQQDTFNNTSANVVEFIANK